uniref:LRRCT domain-containing protein n=1 Tax=Branchiostoma floridae TaxID=7739 RepID=C3YNV9_BRAFL|eukprot:XP_002602057.1 hypothetical protein BRAFLDRAFT_94441 [Branchiostoma floridae]
MAALLKFLLLLASCSLFCTTPAAAATHCPRPCDCFLTRANTYSVYCKKKGLTDVPSGLPANTTYLDLQENRIMNLGNRSLSQMPQLEELILTSNQISNIDSDAFTGTTKLRRLVLTNNELDRVPSDALQPLANLKELFLDDNSITALQADGFVGNANLTHLRLGYNRIGAIDNIAFTKLEKLEVLELQGNLLTEVPEQAFFDLTSLITLHLDHNRLAQLGRGPFQHLRVVQNLYISDQRIPGALQMDFHAFGGLHELTTLELQYCKLTDVPFGQISVIPKLKVLRLTGNYITALPAASLPQNLEEVYLNLMNLTVIQTGTFSGLGKLRVIDLGSNPITTMESGAFQNLPSLQTLGLSRLQRLESVAEDVFMNVRSLEVLDLSYSSLSTFAPIREFTSVRNLTLSGNPIQAITKGDFSHLTQVPVSSSFHLHVHVHYFSYITLPLDNPIQAITKGDFSHLTQITPSEAICIKLSPITLNLTLSGNPIQAITKGDFSHLTQVVQLNLQDAGLREIQADTFTRLRSLVSLDLSNNAISTIPAGTFKNMKNLTQLIIKDSQVKSVSENAFDGLSKLETLDLSYNQIGYIAKGTFKDLNALRELYLQGGRLENIEEKSFDSCKTLHKLHLQSNQLNTLPKDLLSPLESTLKQLGLSGNPWACDCDIVPLATWLKGNQQFPIICASPVELKGNTSNEIDLANLPCTSTLHKHLAKIAPIVIPIIVLLVLAGLGVFFFLRWRKHREGDTTVKYRRTEDSFHLGDVIEDNDTSDYAVGDRSRLEFNHFDKNTQSLVNDTAEEDENREEDVDEDDDDETKRLSNDFGNHVGEATC